MTVVLAEDTIQPGHLQLLANAVPEPAPSHRDATADPWALIDLSGGLPDVSRRVLAEVERRKIGQAMAETGGDRVLAAERLQIPLRFLNAKIREYRLE